MKRIRTGDTVVITTGKSKNHIGKVLKVLDNTVVVEGGNLIKKHLRPNPQINQQGGIVTREAPIDVSNVALYNPISKKADKIGFKFIEKDGKKYKVRYFKSNNEIIDIV
ncbi:50S ribosomal protein L24 [Legionella jordanis]|uniref:Large ribosomal subunit protein uL24 n=1 Tax=Legionella jordanis TaxID=456 RepID=A0A0W0VBX6_9GAMM|nr:50S ribosomal protein L24 [Legionella jordanis]KTD17634.1 50S ribosomal protein L24 [Legionella jordanis]RMX00916.1 50S ribosomal protein L24 [Legionella jordanis]RMX17871.1 50S ribosomal protein L24 [Legionella jordanis]VEH11444.1 50S ribosomal protein L24 [Legionella jordanis]HAT8714940.1 50S ribosomal protein L24 [Legionella jordanis]